MNFKEIFKPATEEELEVYRSRRIELWRKEFFERTDVTKNPDGSYDVRGDVGCNYLRLKSLTELGVKFNKVGGDFYCSGNQLTTLEGAPKSVGRDFYCYSNQLKTLEGSPKSVSGRFNCSGNELKTLEGAPESIGGGFYCSKNQLTTLEGAPKSVGGHFWCYDQKSGIEFTEEQVRAVSEVKGKVTV